MRRHRPLRIVAGLLACVLANACSLAPGMRMQQHNFTAPTLPGWPEPETQAERQTEPQSTPIDEALLARMAKAEPPARKAEPLAEPAPQPYRIGAGDVLNITVWEHPELNLPEPRTGTERASEGAAHVVGPDGQLFFPWAGQLRAQGRTLDDFRRVLTEKLARVIRDPQVSVRIESFRSQRVHVGGEVEHPGLQPITEVPMRLTDAVQAAGGGTSNADFSQVELRRKGQAHHLNLRAFYELGDTTQNPVLQEGDIVNLPSLAENQVFVLGEVLRPGTQVLGARAVSLTEALALAGGLDPQTASPGRIYVVRGAESGREIFQLDARSADALALAERFSLKPRDVIFVDAAGVARWNRFVSQILASSSTLQRASATDFPLFHGNERKVSR